MRVVDFFCESGLVTRRSDSEKIPALPKQGRLVEGRTGDAWPFRPSLGGEDATNPQRPRDLRPHRVLYPEETIFISCWIN